MKQTTAALLISGLWTAGTVFGALPAGAQSPAPQISISRSADTSEPGEAASPPAAAAETSGEEVLPWTGKPLTPMATLPEGEGTATDVSAAQCNGLFEAACRDLKACAWLADISRGDGTVTAAHCVARPAAPPKKAAAKKSSPPKKAAVSTEGKAPAVKASVTRVEPEKPAAVVPAAESTLLPPEKAPPKTETEAAAPKKAEPEPVAQAEAPATDQAPEPPKAKEKTAQETPSTMPSFGSISGFGGDNAIVVTVPPSAD